MASEVGAHIATYKSDFKKVGTPVFGLCVLGGLTLESAHF